jgi:hypothetical protein
MIKDRSTSTAKAVFNLNSLNKWCLSGTPLQNRVGELYSLVRFLRIDPHAFYYCRRKDCDCKSLHYRFTRGICNDCGHTAMQHFCHFNKHILNPIGRSGFVGEGKKAMMKLKEQVLDEILLRRTKTNRADDIQLPPRIVKVIRYTVIYICIERCICIISIYLYKYIYVYMYTYINTYMRCIYIYTYIYIYIHACIGQTRETRREGRGFLSSTIHSISGSI